MMRDTLKPIIRRLFSGALYYGGYCALVDRVTGEAGGHILCYHDVADQPTSSFTVAKADFEAQMRFLVEHATLLSAEKLAQIVRENRTIPPRAVAVTIDDGYRSVYTHIHPILRQYGIPATVFLPTRCIDGGLTSYAAHPWAKAEFMNWDQVRVLAREGVAMGSHTLDHLSLPALAEGAIREQLELSKGRIEDETGQAVTGFAYPYGLPHSYRGTEHLVAEAGYTWAVSGVHGSVRRRRASPLALRRVKVERGDGLPVFSRLVRGAMDPWQLIDLLR